MNAQSPAAGQNYEYAVSIEKIQSRTKKLCLAVVSAALCTLMFWLSMGTADYVRVMKFHERPLFCVASDLNEQGGCFYGFGYSFDISCRSMPTAIFAETRAIGYPLAFEARADERETLGLTSMT